jgi:hypothetical protein
VWPRRRLLQYFDSLGSSQATSDWVLDTLQRWLLTDAEDKGVILGSMAATDTEAGPCAGGSRANSDGWRKESTQLRIPAQVGTYFNLDSACIARLAWLPGASRSTSPAPTLQACVLSTSPGAQCVPITVAQSVCVSIHPQCIAVYSGTESVASAVCSPEGS